jgi:hypothetical protein
VAPYNGLWRGLDQALIFLVVVWSNVFIRDCLSHFLYDTKRKKIVEHTASVF